MKCLIVDDEEFNRDYVAALLGNDSECVHAGNGRDAVEKFAGALESNAPYDLILLDIMMPEMGGHEAARSIRSIEKERGLHVEKWSISSAYFAQFPTGRHGIILHGPVCGLSGETGVKREALGNNLKIRIKQEKVILSEVFLNIQDSDKCAEEKAKLRIILAVTDAKRKEAYISAFDSSAELTLREEPQGYPEAFAAGPMQWYPDGRLSQGQGVPYG